MQTDWNVNRAVLRGTAAAAPVVSHENHGMIYWTFPLAVLRLSDCPVGEGTCVEVEGEVRSFNNKSGKGSRLVISLYARTLVRAEGEHLNTLELVGVLCKPPILRHTPLGREICDLMLAVNRRYGRADYLPCIAWGALAQRCGALGVGDAVHIEGRFQSRKYTKVFDGESVEKTAYEISVMKLEQAGEEGKPSA